MKIRMKLACFGFQNVHFHSKYVDSVPIYLYNVVLCLKQISEAISFVDGRQAQNLGRQLLYTDGIYSLFH